MTLLSMIQARIERRVESMHVEYDCLLPNSWCGRGLACFFLSGHARERCVFLLLADS